MPETFNLGSYRPTVLQLGESSKNSSIVSFDELEKFTGVTALGVTNNRNYAPFMACTNLKSVVLPVNAAKLYRSSFENCSSLENLVVDWSKISIIEQDTFKNCTSLSIDNLSLPNLETLGDNAFYGVSIKKISNLGKITALPAGGTPIQNFGKKDVLEEVVLPETLTSIPNGSFYQYTNCVIEDLNLPDLTTLGGGAFNGTKLRKITSLGSVTSLPNQSSNTGPVFGNCTELTHIEQSVLDRFTYISDAFSGCSNLEIEELKLPSLEGTITHGFSKCNKIKKVVDLGKITAYFGNTALNYVSYPFGENVELIVIPESVQSIGRYGFVNHKNTLKTIIVKPTTPPQCAAYWTNGMPSDTIFYVPDASVTAYREASNWSGYADRILPLSEYTE